MCYGSFIYGGLGAAIPGAMLGAAKERSVALFPGDGSAVWAAAHVDDFGALLADAVERAPVGGSRLFAAAHLVTIREAAQAVGEALGLPTQSASSRKLPRRTASSRRRSRSTMLLRRTSACTGLAAQG